MVTASRHDGFSLIEVLLVVAIIAIIAGISVPLIGNTIGNFRLNGDARALSNTVSLARMQAASNFARTRLYVDLNTGVYHTEIKVGAAPWTPRGTVMYLTTNDSFNFGPVTAPPPNPQATIAQASACLDAASQPIANTACFVFNSRGIPVDSTLAPTGAYALYVTDGTSVCAITASATGVIRLWRTGAIATPLWVRQ